jgi:UDP-glucuronate decarboxylase
MSKILITGGAGFIASSLARRIAENPEDELVLVDNLATGDPKNIPSSSHNNVRFIKADVNDFQDIASIFHSWKFDYVFHLAAVVGVQRTLKNPVKVLGDIDGIRNILTLCKNTGVQRVYFSSSSEVYGEPFEFPQNEHTTPLNSRLPYAIVKNVGEAYLRAFEQEYHLPYTIFRYFNTYGPNQSKDFVVSKFILHALKGEDLHVYGDGLQTRTFCYVDDNVEACHAIFRQQACKNQVINIGSDVEIPIVQLAHQIIKLTGSSSQVVHLSPLEEGDMTRRCPDIKMMKNYLPAAPITLEEGLKIVIDAFKPMSNVRN